MTWATVAAVGGSLLGGVLSSKGAKQAGNVQADAQREAAQLQLTGVREGNALLSDMYINNLGIQAPQLRSGQTALSALQSGMGLGPLLMESGYGNTSGDVGGGGGSYLDAQGRAYTGDTMTNAAGQVTDAAGNVLTARQDVGMNPGLTQEQADAAASPYAGTFLEQFSGQDIYRDPSYQFRLEEGQKALMAKQAAGGNRWGSQAMKDIVNYGQGAASQEYGNAYTRFMQQKEQLFNRLSGMAGMAGSTSGSIASQGTSTAGNMAHNISSGYGGAAGNIGGAGTAQAGGIVGSTNALVGGMNQAGNTWLAREYFNKVNQPGVPPQG